MYINILINIHTSSFSYIFDQISQFWIKELSLVIVSILIPKRQWRIQGGGRDEIAPYFFPHHFILIAPYF